VILLTGVTGNVGGEVLKQLAEKKTPIRVLARDPSKLQGMQGDSLIEAVRGDLSDSTSLEKALQGARSAFFLPPVDPRSTEYHDLFIDAARKAGVGHIVKLSAMGADPNASMTFGRWHGEGEKRLEESGIAYTHLRPSAFMQNILAFAAPIARQGMIFQPAGDAKISFVDVRDIAAVAVAALTETGHEGRTYEITGPEALSYFDVARIFADALGKTVIYVPTSPEDAHNALAASGVEEWRIQAILELYADYREGHGETVTNVVSEVARKQPFSYREFVRDHMSAFQA
jgi:uncharacterized protein YbjT (DUF2867 family)